MWKGLVSYIDVALKGEGSKTVWLNEQPISETAIYTLYEGWRIMTVT